MSFTQQAVLSFAHEAQPDTSRGRVVRHFIKWRRAFILGSQKLIQEGGDECFGRIIFAHVEFAALVEQADAVKSGPEDFGFFAGLVLILAQRQNRLNYLVEYTVDRIMVGLGVMLHRDGEQQRPEVRLILVEIEVGLRNFAQPGGGICSASQDAREGG